VSKHDNTEEAETTIVTVEDDAAVGADTETDDAVDTDAVEPDAIVTDADASDAAVTAPDAAKRDNRWRVVAFVLLPALALILALGAGYLKFLDNSYSSGEVGAGSGGKLSLAEESVRAARDGTITLLSYQPDKVEQQLGDARKLLTGEFRDSYTSLTHDVVIPGAKEKQISAVASVPAAASVSASPTEAVVLVFVNQTVTVGGGAPTDTASSVRITLEKEGDRWLISKFDPV
jgi:Mce-associated membrane protein